MMKVMQAVIVAVAVGVAGASSATQEPCPAPFELVGEQCYFFSNNKLNWTDSRQYCQTLMPDRSADLAVFDLTCCDYRHLIAHMDLSGFQDTYCLGGSSFGHDGYWAWVDGRPIDLGANYWMYDEPEPTDYYVYLGREGGHNRYALWSLSGSFVHLFICQLDVHAMLSTVS